MDLKENISTATGFISSYDRAGLLKQQSVTIWFTGLSGAGKTTLSYALEKALFEVGKLAYTLDGDNLRHGLCRNLGFSQADRSENIRRIAEVAHLMNDSGVIVIVACISPNQSDRDIARSIIGSDRFFEVYVNTPISVCEKNDTKGLYKKARAGEIKEFTGVSANYEAPVTPDLSLDASTLSVTECVLKLMAHISK
ncbi:TPA: adenylyl-sulfate kinase [Pseudomonas putida]|nr:adenylyl-sulfate kinase [Pseudomonas putida]